MKLIKLNRYRMALVSIIIPVYKVEKYLCQCIDSIRNQTLKDIEIILIDDESPDKCPVICDEYARKDHRIKVIHKKNGGLGLARNSGLEIATGEYVSFLDSDDYELPNTYETLYSIARRDCLDVVYYKFLDTGCFKPSAELYDSKESLRELMLNIVANSPEKQKDRNIAVSSCVALYKRSVLLLYNICFHSERVLISEDLIFNLDFLIHASNAVVTNYQFYFYRVNNDSLSHTIRNDRFKKTLEFYHYLLNKKEIVTLGWEGKERCMRLFIGYSRSIITQICQSTVTLKEKKKMVEEIVNNPIWIDIYNNYPRKVMPYKHRLFLELIYRKCLFLLYFVSKVG